MTASRRLVLCIERGAPPSTAEAIAAGTILAGDEVRLLTLGAPAADRAQSSARLGALAARNSAARDADGRLIVFASGDALPVLPLLRRAFELWRARRAPLVCVGAEPRPADPIEAKWGTLLREATEPSECILWDSEALVALGGYDVAFDALSAPRWYGEIDLQRRAHRRGMLIGSVGAPTLAVLSPPDDIVAEARLAARQLGWGALAWVAISQRRPALRSAWQILSAVNSARRLPDVR